MKTNLEPGKYVVAVSGGVDSVVLLDLLAKQSGCQLVVAHFDHGIRPDSAKDSLFVEKLAQNYGLEFYCEEGKLGPNASEELAREKRYEFLRKVKEQTGSQAIVTAHHQDDSIETAIINIIRGTGRKGLSSLKSTNEIKRPLLASTKEELTSYARKNNLSWHDDLSNTDQKYLRNYVRHSVIPQLSPGQKAKLLDVVRDSRRLNEEADALLDGLAAQIFEENKIKRRLFAALPHDLSKELLAHWLRARNITFDSRMLERLSVFLKTGRPGSQADVSGGYVLAAQKDFISLSHNQSL